MLLAPYSFMGNGNYVSTPVDYNGSSTLLARGSGLTGAVDGSQGTLFFCVRFDGDDGAEQTILTDDGGYIHVYKTTGNKLAVQVNDTTASIALAFESATSYTAGATWLRVLASWDTNFTAGNKLAQLYVNGASDIGTITDVGTAFNIDYTRSAYEIGATTTPNKFLNGCLGDLYLCTTTRLDISTAPNQAKFYDGSLHPKNLSVSGAPSAIIYMKNPAATDGVNSGTGGDFTPSGVHAACSSSPSN